MCVICCVLTPSLGGTGKNDSTKCDLPLEALGARRDKGFAAQLMGIELHKLLF